MYVTGEAFPKLPAATVAAARRAILDTLGVTLAGAVEPTAERVRTMIEHRRAGHEATIVGATAALEDADWIFPCYREHGAALLRGMPLPTFLCDLVQVVPGSLCALVEHKRVARECSGITSKRLLDHQIQEILRFVALKCHHPLLIVEAE